MTAQSLDGMNRIRLNLVKEFPRLVGGKTDGFVKRQYPNFGLALRAEAAHVASPVHSHDKDFMTFGRD
jgi:hypothetical protein